MATHKLFVGDLSPSIDDAGLRVAFEKFGLLATVNVVLDGDDGPSRGFGFVTFVNKQAAKSAMREMNGAELDGQPIKVSAAEKSRPAPKPNGFRGADTGGGGRFGRGGAHSGGGVAGGGGHGGGQGGGRGGGRGGDR